MNRNNILIHNVLNVNNKLIYVKHVEKHVRNNSFINVILKIYVYYVTMIKLNIIKQEYK